MVIRLKPVAGDRGGVYVVRNWPAVFAGAIAALAGHMMLLDTGTGARFALGAAGNSGAIGELAAALSRRTGRLVVYLLCHELK